MIKIQSESIYSGFCALLGPISQNITSTININNSHMQIQLHPKVQEALNLQYKTHNFKTYATLQELVQCTIVSMKENFDQVNFDLTGAIIDRYNIKVKVSEEDPFTIQSQSQIKELVDLTEGLFKAFDGLPNLINKQLELIKDFIVKHGTTIKINPLYHKFILYFKYINIKEALIFESLRRCQILYTIIRERRKSGKQFYLDPLIACFENIKVKLGVNHPFIEKVLPKKQVKLFEKKNTVKKMKNALFEAVSNRRYHQVKELISNGASIEEPGINERQNNRQMNCSHRACQLGDLEMCRTLQEYKVNWQAKEKEGMTPLHYAVQAGNLNLVKFLVEEVKVDLQSKDIQNRTPFYFSCTEGDLPTIKYLYEKGANINNQSSLGRSALSKACYLGLIEVVSFLMNCPGIQLEVSDTKGRTALHNSVFGPKGGRQGHKFGTNQSDSPECTQLLLENGFSVDIPDKEMNTPMHVAMSSDGIDSIRVLLAFGASLTALNCYGQTPLMTGAKFGHINAVKTLKQQFGGELTYKDIFNKNIMLLCAKFRQDNFTQTNDVFYYSTDELLGMASRQEKLEVGDNRISNWQAEISYTFSQLLKQYQRAGPQFIYFCLKLKYFNLQIPNLTLEHVKQLFDIIKRSEEKDILQITQYILFNRSEQDRLQVQLKELEIFVEWILCQNSVKLLQFVTKVQPRLKALFIIKNQKEQFSFSHCLASSFFQLLPELREKVVTYCLMRLNINWPQYCDSQSNFNIIHLLIRSKKIGSLIQVFKVLSGIKLDFVSNQYIIIMQNKQDIYKESGKGESPLSSLMKRLIIQKDKEGFDPYNLALLLKDASASKLIQSKISEQTNFYKSQFDVKDYKINLETNPEQLQKFNKGYDLQNELDEFIKIIQDCQNVNQLQEYFSILDQKIMKEQIIGQFQQIWRNCGQRKIVEISDIQNVATLYELEKQSIIGLDVEYFYIEGATLISIMQISSLKQDYLIDFLTSAKDPQTNYEFIHAVRKALSGMASSRRIMKIMHGSDNDLCLIRSILKISFLNFMDTARVDVELRKQQSIRGLSALVKQFLKQHMSKDYQVSQWRIRPIPHSMTDYARRDSLVLPYLARSMLGNIQLGDLKQILIAGCRQARRNKKTSQPLINSYFSV